MPIVWEKPDGSVRIMRLTKKFLLENRQDGELTADTVRRLAIVEQEKNPDLQNATPHLVPTASLPPRIRADAQNDPCPCRDGWRWNGTAVVVDESAISPNWSRLLGRLQAVLPPNQRVLLALEFAAIREAAQTQDAALFQAVYDRLKTAIATATPPLTQAQWDAVKLTITEKKIPITL